MPKFSFFIFIFIFSNPKLINENLIKIKENSINSKRVLINDLDTGKTNSKKNLIIVSISDYDWNKIAIFFNSYSRANFENTDLVVYVNNIKENVINKIKSFGVKIIRIPEEYKKYSIINSRWKLYTDFLKQNKDKYNLIFTADAKDLFFQKDVFKFYQNIQKPFLGIALEDGFIGQSPENKEWTLKIYGEELFEKIKNERIICVDTVWGSIDKFCEFSEKMWEKLSSEWGKNKGLVDKYLVNVLIYHDKLYNDCIIFNDNIDGPVMTIALTNRVFINLDKDNNILNKKGDVAAVVHQYDRKEDLTQIVINKYYPDLNKIKIRNYFNHYLHVILLFIGCIICSFILGILYSLRYNNNKSKIFPFKKIEYDEGK